jgi:hypothetical protein
MSNYICPHGHGSIRKSPLADGSWGYYHPTCHDCGEEALDLNKLIEIANSVSRLDEAKWSPNA